jgi:hypothetical protein
MREQSGLKLPELNESAALSGFFCCGPTDLYPILLWSFEKPARHVRQ